MFFLLKARESEISCDVKCGVQSEKLKRKTQTKFLSKYTLTLFILQFKQETGGQEQIIPGQCFYSIWHKPKCKIKIICMDMNLISSFTILLHEMIDGNLKNEIDIFTKDFGKFPSPSTINSSTTSISYFIL